MRKIITLSLLALTFGLTSCSSDSNNDSTPNEGTTTENVVVEKLVVGYVPSRPADEILEATKPLEGLLQDELSKLGFDVKEVEIEVGTNYEAVGEALDAGTMHVGFIPGGTYVLYDEGAEVILTATRNGLNKDSENAKDWNDGKPTETTTDQVTYYRSLVIAGPSEKGKELAEKVNAGEKLTWEDINSANVQYMNTTSSAGYIYPTLWMMENFDGKKLTDLDSASAATGYSAAFSALKAETADVTFIYADARRDNLAVWEDQETSIWEDVQVIGVTEGIYNDTISVTKDEEVMTDELQAALQTAFINIGNSEAGAPIIAIYNHNGYEVAQDSDYDGARNANKLTVKED